MSQPSRPQRSQKPTKKKRLLDEDAAERPATKKLKRTTTPPNASQNKRLGPSTLGKKAAIKPNRYGSSSKQRPTQEVTVLDADTEEDEDKSDDEDLEEVSDKVEGKHRQKQRKLRIEDVNSQEDVDEIKERWTSLVYAFYDPDPTFEVENGRGYIAFRCLGKKCGGRQIIRRYLDTADRGSTKNLQSHITSCWGPEVYKRAQSAVTVEEAKEKVIDPYRASGSLKTAFQMKGKGKTYSNRQLTKIETKTEIVRWVCESIRPMRIVSDRGFLTLMKTGRPDYYIPSPSTVSRDVKQVFVNVRNRVARMLFASKSRISLQMDAWTSPNHKAYVGIMASFEEDGKRKTLVLDMVAVSKSHSGKNLAETLKKVVKEFRIIKKVLGVSMDNASVNDVVVDEFELDLKELWRKVYHVRCLLHVVSLTSKSLLAPFDSKKKGKGKGNENDDDEDDDEGRDMELDDLAKELNEAKANWETSREDDEVNGEEAVEDNIDGWIDETDNLSFTEAADLRRGRVPVKKVLCKLRTLAFKMIHSTTKFLPLWYTILKGLELKPRLIPRDVATRWNSTFDLADVSLEYKDAIDMITKERELRPFELSKEDWKLVKDLRDVLQTLKNATEYFSRETSDLSHVLRSIDRIDDHFTNSSDDPSLNPALRSAILCAKKTLNRYYGRTDESITYCIATILNPTFKLAYFRDRKWLTDWTNEAIRVLREEYTRVYDKGKDSGKDVEVVNEGERATVKKNGTKKRQNEFDDVPTFAPTIPTSLAGELDDYLNSPPENLPGKMTVLEWWVECRIHYPHLSRMALDYLVISPSSVDVERLFSRGRLVLSHVRSRLSVETTRAILCLGSWSVMGLVEDDDVRKAVEEPDIPEDQKEEDPVDGWDTITCDDDE